MEAQLLAFLKQFLRILAQQQVIHPLDDFTGGMLVTADEAVPARVPDQLHPRQIHLHQRRAAPLASFQQDDTHRLACHTLLFHHGQQTALRPVEHKGHIATLMFVPDGDATRAPVFKVVHDALALLLQRLQCQIIGTTGQHISRDTTTAGLDTVAATTHSHERVIAALC